MTETNTCSEIYGIRQKKKKKMSFGESSTSLYNCNYDVRMSFVKNQVHSGPGRGVQTNRIRRENKEHKVFSNTGRMNKDKESKK